LAELATLLARSFQVGCSGPESGQPGPARDREGFLGRRAQITLQYAMRGRWETVRGRLDRSWFPCRCAVGTEESIQLREPREKTIESVPERMAIFAYGTEEMEPGVTATLRIGGVHPAHERRPEIGIVLGVEPEGRNPRSGAIGAKGRYQSVLVAVPSEKQ